LAALTKVIFGVGDGVGKEVGNGVGDNVGKEVGNGVGDEVITVR
jgi:hypothetical protein